MTGNTVGLQSGASSLTYPPDVLWSAADGRENRSILQVGIPGFQGGVTGGTSVPYHLQCGGACGVPALF